MFTTKIVYDNEDCHMGRQTLKTLKKYQDDIHQIEIVTGATETHGSFRTRTIRMAQAMKARGFKIGDVVMIISVSHNDQTVPYVASLYIGAVPLCLDTNMKHLEIKHMATISKPKIIFADPTIAPTARNVLAEMGSKSEVVTFGDKPLEGFTHFSEMVKETGTEESFECEDFDPKTTLGLLACSSGTTGLPKLVAVSHFALFYTIYLPRKNIPDQRNLYGVSLGFSPLYWISGSVIFLSSCLFGITRCQSIRPFCPEDFVNAIEKYKPTVTLTSQLALCTILEYAEKHKIDFSCLRIIFHGGMPVSEDSIERLTKLAPHATIAAGYGCTEVMCITGGLESRKGSCGKPANYMDWKIVDPETEKQLGPHKPGELRVKSVVNFVCYYNKPEETAAAYDSDGYYRTGDLVYYDEEGFFYIVGRLKELIKYRNFQVNPSELENVITGIPGVLVSAVVGIPHHEDSEHPMAFVQLEPGAKVSAKAIQDFVKENLSDRKHLRGGVVFLDKLPISYAGKIDRKKLNMMKNDYKSEEAEMLAKLN